MSLQAPSSYVPLDRLKIWLNGVQFGSTLASRRLNFSNNFNITEDAGNNFFNIDVAPLGKVTLPNTIVYTDQINTYGQFAQVFPSFFLKLQGWPSLAHNFVFSGADITADRAVKFPLLPADDTFVFTTFPQTLLNKTGNFTGQTDLVQLNGVSALTVNTTGSAFDFHSNTITTVRFSALNSASFQIWNPAFTFTYSLLASAISGNRNITIPLLAADDIFAFCGFNNAWTVAQNLPNLSSIGTNIIFSTSGLSAPRTFTFPDQSDKFSSNNSFDTIKNKDLSDPSNTFPANLGSPLPSKLGARWGTFQGANTSVSGEGLLGQLSTTPNTGTVVSTFINNRPATAFPSGSNSGNSGGFRTTNQICTPSLNPSMAFKVTMSTNATDRCILGLSSSNTPATTGFNHILDNISGFFIGFGSGDTNYSVVTNNGSATESTTTTGMPTIQTAGTAAIFTLAWTNSNTTLAWSVNKSGTVSSGTINTGNLPASSTQLYLYCTCQTNANSAVTMSIEDVEISLGSTLDYTAF